MHSTTHPFIHSNHPFQLSILSPLIHPPLHSNSPAFHPNHSSINSSKYQKLINTVHKYRYITENRANRARTTDVFRPDTMGSCTSLQRFSSNRQAGMNLMTSSGSVASLTSERPLAHADELTNQKKVKIAVTTKS